MRVSDSKENKVTKGQYDYQRKTLGDDLVKRIGPCECCADKFATSRKILSK